MSAENGSERLAHVLAESLGQLDVTTEPQDVADHLELIGAVCGLEVQTRVLLNQAVTSARAAGATWAAIGATLGMSKQAAQKRFSGRPAPVTSELDPRERIIGPVTAFNEMGELALAGRYGWHSVEFGLSFHRVVHSPTQWEHARVSMLTSKARSLQAEGWEVVGSSFPYTYLKRDLGTTALSEVDVTGSTPGSSASSATSG